MDIYNVLGIGEDNALHMQEIADLYDVEPDVIKREIRKERAEHVILSSKNGYYKPANKQEIERFYYKMLKQARTHFNSIKTAERALNEIEGQLSFSERRING